MSLSSPPRRPRVGRRVLPLPPSFADGRPLGHSVISELDDRLALPLWRGLRDIRLWQTTRCTQGPVFPANDPHARPCRKDATPAAHEPEWLLMPPDALRLELEAGSAGTVSVWCRRVAGWAHARGYDRTAMEFAEAGAYLQPHDALHCRTAGLACYAIALHVRAEWWFHRAAALARLSGGRAEYVSAVVGLSDCLFARGQHQQALGFRAHAARSAYRFGQLRRAAALHMSTSERFREIGSHEQARHHTRMSLRCRPAAPNP